jgi:hypothetical protein
MFPTTSVVAGLATLRRETPAVRIRVAVRTPVERKARISRLAVLTWGVALLAGNLHVQSGQRIACLSVIKLARNSLPGLIVVTLQTVLTKAPVVLILVTSNATCGKTEKGSAEVLELDAQALGRWDVLWSVALLTLQAGVFSLKEVTGLPVIKSFAVPFDERKLAAIMLGMAARAFLARTWFDPKRAVKALPGSKPARHLAVAIEAAQDGCATHSMAARALGVAIQKRVWIGERPGRDLSSRRPGEKQRDSR